MSALSRFRMLIGAVSVVALVVVSAPTAYASVASEAKVPSSAPPYYLALGDSLSQGVQPNPSGQSIETNQGYVDDLYAVYQRELPGLRLAKLGCPGETTDSMIHGGICPYGLGNQLAQAVSFLHTHHVAVVTIDIGANNVDGCVTAGTNFESCAAKGMLATSIELPVILATLRAAAPGVPIVGMNYYDPFLAAWLLGSAGRDLAVQTLTMAVVFNSVISSTFEHFSDPVADVETAFQTTNWTNVPSLGAPLNVSLVCALTWMCTPSPLGPNIHANPWGYATIAAAFFRELPQL